MPKIADEDPHYFEFRPLDFDKFLAVIIPHDDHIP